MNDIVVNKIASIQRCVARARDEYYKNPSVFTTDYTQQDAAMLNILRACENALDLANHTIKRYKLGVPSSSADSFELLRRNHVIDRTLADALQRMVRFRNTAIHQYDDLDIDIVVNVIIQHLDDIVRFTDAIMEKFQEE